MHTNNLNLGDNNNGLSVVIYGKGVTIDDNGGDAFTTAGLTITVNSGGATGEYIQSVGSPLSISATAKSTSSLLMTSTGETGAALYLDGGEGSGTVGVQLTASNSITVDQNMSVANYNSSDNWTVNAPTGELE